MFSSCGAVFYSFGVAIYYFLTQHFVTAGLKACLTVYLECGNGFLVNINKLCPKKKAKTRLEK